MPAVAGMLRSMFDDCIIIAGGSGTRLWPASSTAKPKQFLPVSAGGKTFFHTALERALAVSAETVIVIAGKAHVPPILKDCAGLSGETKKRIVLIPEPAPKNTAPAIACAAVYADRSFPQKDRKLLVLTSDHLIAPLETFKEDAVLAEGYAGTETLGVFGIPPKGPETGYGYIETAEKPLAPRVFRAVSFREKPDRQTAERFLAAGGFYWNSGMFAFSSSRICEEFRQTAPEVFSPFDALETPESTAYAFQEGIKILSGWKNLEKAYAETKAVSFDYAIAEKCARTVMIAVRFDWRDIGSWDEYAALLGDSGGEVYRSGGGAEKSCFVDADIPVALCGVEDLIVVIRSGKDGRPGSALIAKKGETQRVREAVEQIRRADRTELL
ncbi:MAG: mannose-1-phosphate guanylyltransferase [Spirochaetaceae bacterium]|jgi:mannose-1-phosphate guanylyltransferase/mannose-1-phosphate guanylyltransferase/mannose-6-phosphate isomerase|nr:mannose-1-phosphate guanylyltransferase [Spirochaetaceae bacterium]